MIGSYRPEADIQFFIYLPITDSEKFQIRMLPTIEKTPSKIHPFSPRLMKLYPSNKATIAITMKNGPV